ncbi:hypothetical protein [Bacillus sp. V5-8f]|uniref:hypothetical protein n=1 Tax=Bacillus sp. V5-8f TaxID=2053044 RepID=UPI0011576F77|nr:hypothetical protein [Bacillus sp. V5-8f]
MVISGRIVEPSGAAGLASLKQSSDELSGRKVAIVVTGRNISWSRFVSLVDKTPIALPKPYKDEP